MPIVSVSNQNDYRSVPRQNKNPCEHNQKDATATTQRTNIIRDIPVFRRNGHAEKILEDLPSDTHGQFSKSQNRRRRKYNSCDQNHDPRNWNWKPWQHLERLCLKRGLDDFAVKDILVEHLGRKLECECQVLYDERELRKEALRRQFGVDSDSGEVGLVD